MTIAFRAFLVFCLLLTALAAFGQSTSGTFVGRVVDPSGAAVPGAALLARNTDTGQVLKAQTSGSGEYVIYSAPPGRYTITAEVSGFKKGVASDVVLAVGGAVRADFNLEVGTLAQQVEVTAHAELQTESGSVENLVTREQVVNMPLNGRDFNQLVLLSAGAVDNTLPTAGNYDFGSYALNGNRSYSNDFQLDGVPNNNLFQNKSAFSISIDAIREFKVLSADSSAEFGQAGAQITMVTQSGTNKLHGSAFEFYRGTQMQARDPFNTDPTQPYKRNQFGGSIGGPIRRDRTFFFFNYEGNRLYSAEIKRALVPSEAMWKGDFSELLARNIQVRDPLVTGRPVIPGNRLDTYLNGARLNQTALKMKVFFPAPNATGTTNMLATPEGSTIGNQFTFRVDQQLPWRTTVNVRGTYSNNGQYRPNLLGTPGVGLNEPNNARNGSVGLTTILNPATVNEFRFGAMNFSDIVHYVDGGLGSVESFGLKGFDNATGMDWIPPLPRITFSGTDAFQQFQYGYNSGYGAAALSMINNVYTWGDTIRHQRGKHSLRAGFEARRTLLNILQQSNARGQLTFSGSATSANSTGYSFADFLMGLPSSTQQTAIKPKGLLKQTDYAGFIQDDWKVAARLTLNMGLRYELFMNPYEVRNRISNFDPVTGAIVVASDNGKAPVADYNQALMARFLKADGTYTFPLLTDVQAKFAPRTLVANDTNNWGPRFGFSYMLAKKTVIRGGYGMFYSRYPRQYLLQTMFVNPPFAGILSYSQRLTNFVPALTLDAPYAATGTAPSVAPVGLQEDFMLPDNQQWNLALQREIGWKTVVTLGYLGNKGTHLFRTINLNGSVPDPNNPGLAVRRYQSTYGTSTMNYRTTDADSIYNSMRLEARKTMSNGLSFQSSWTWAKGLDDTGQNVQSAIMDIESRGRDRADSDYVRRHIVTANAQYLLPFGRGKAFLSRANTWQQAFVGGWQVGGIFRAQTGRYLTPSFTQTATNVLSNNRPDRVAGVSTKLPSDQRNTYHWFNLNAFAVPATIDVASGEARFGNAGRNIIQGPGLNTMDLSVYKTFNVGGKKSDRPKTITFRMEMFNALNHVNYSDPALNMTIDPSNPGRFTSVGSTAGTISQITVQMRQTQFALRFDF